MAQKRNRPAFNITIDPLVKERLMEKAEKKGVKASVILSALAKIYCELPVDETEAPIEKDLKIKYGRDQFLAFLKSVAQVIPPEAKPIMKPDVKPEYQPDTWTLGTTGILAFFNPNGENVGHVFSAASTLKAEHKLNEVLVVSPLADTMPESARSDLAGAKIEVVSIANLTAKLKKYARKKK